MSPPGGAPFAQNDLRNGYARSIRTRPLTADVRKADAAGKSYGYWRLDELLKEQKAREELDNLIERNRERRERKEHEQQQEKA